MKNIFSFLSFWSLKKNISDVAKRFPLPFIFSALTFCLFLLVIWLDDFFKDYLDNIFKLILTFIVCFFFSVWLDLFLEEFSLDKLKNWLIKIIPILFGFGFYYFLNLDNEFESAVYIILTLTWFLGFLFISSFFMDFFKKRYSENLYYNYFFKVSLSFLFSFILWWVLFALWTIWIWAVTTLFNLEDYLEVWKFIWYWASFSLSLVAPIFWLINLPEKNSLDKENFYENKFFSFLVKYIWIPFIYVYFLILYAYTVKVLINFSDWPKWEVSWMVIGFSTFWYLIYIFSYIFEEKTNYIKVFRKYFPYVVFPQLFMLFYAIYLRIAQYDLTINRYFVVVFWLWLLALSAYYIFSTKKYLWFISMSLSFFIIIISIWPWWVYNLPEARQYDRLISNLEKAKILNGENITPLKNYQDIDKELSNNIYSWISYLCNTYDCENIKELFKEELSKEEERARKEFYENNQKEAEKIKMKWDEVPEYLLEEYDWMSKWEIVSFLWEYLNVYDKYSYVDEQKYLNFGKNYDESFYPISLEDYSYLVNISEVENTTKDNISIKVDVDLKKLDLVKDWKIVESFSLEQINNSLIDVKGKSWKNDLKVSDLTFLLVWEKSDIKIFFENYTLLNPDFVSKDKNDNYYYKSVNWVALVKMK